MVIKIEIQILKYKYIHFKDAYTVEWSGTSILDTWRGNERKRQWKISNAIVYFRLRDIGLSIAEGGMGVRELRERFSLALGNTCQSVSRIFSHGELPSPHLTSPHLSLASDSSNRCDGIRVGGYDRYSLSLAHPAWLLAIVARCHW